MRAPVDLRSDTVTHPTDSMRRAMAAAEVGDDVYGEDPTVRRLEERAAELLGFEAGLLVPSGTMGNQIAVHLHTRPGSEVIGEAGCHIFNYEMGAMATLSGALPRPVTGPGGVLEPEAVRAAINPRTGYTTPTALLALENTHNLAGGRTVPATRMDELITIARQHGLKVHLDGARVFNAAAALDTSPSELAAGCDTVMFCLSKGLAAPVGSLLVGGADLIGEARRVRKMLGGGMRQAGVLAAAGLVALDEMVPRIADDHVTARRLAGRLAALPAIDLDADTVDTNIVFFRMADRARLTAGELARRLADEGILVHALGPGSVRAVTHYQISADDVDHAADAVERVLGGA